MQNSLPFLGYRQHVGYQLLVQLGRYTGMWERESDKWLEMSLSEYTNSENTLRLHHVGPPKHSSSSGQISCFSSSRAVNKLTTVQTAFHLQALCSVDVK